MAGPGDTQEVTTKSVPGDAAKMDAQVVEGPTLYEQIMGNVKSLLPTSLPPTDSNCKVSTWDQAKQYGKGLAPTIAVPLSIGTLCSNPGSALVCALNSEVVLGAGVLATLGVAGTGSYLARESIKQAEADCRAGKTAKN